MIKLYFEFQSGHGPHMGPDHGELPRRVVRGGRGHGDGAALRGGHPRQVRERRVPRVQEEAALSHQVSEIVIHCIIYIRPQF